MEGLRKVNEFTQFEDGRMIEKIKFKPLGLPMKNRVTVMIFDAITKKLKQKTVTENILNNSLDKLAYMDYFYQRVKGNPTSFAYPSPFQYLVLTDSTEAESSAEQYMKGNIIGYAEKLSAYSGSDLLRGTANTNESNLADSGNTGYLKFVYDFGSTIANGTFRSVWWNATVGLNFALLKSLVSSNTNSDHATADAEVVGNIMYVSGCGNYGNFLIDKFNLDTLEYIETIDLSKKTTVFSNNGCQYLSGIAYYNGNFYIYGGYSTHKIFVFDSNFNYTRMITLNYGSNTTLNTKDLNHLKIVNGYLYLAAGNSQRMVQFDSSGNYIADCAINAYDPPLTKLSDDILLLGNQYISIKNNTLSVGAVISNSFGYAGVIYNNRYIYINGKTIYSNLLVPPATQCLLPTAVAKDASQTMKIVYEFNIDMVNPYDAS